MKIYTLGPDKSFSALGSREFLEKLSPDLHKSGLEISLENSFPEIWSRLHENPANFAILPIENTSSSSVHENIDAIFDFSKIKIFAEFFLQINLHLIGLNGAIESEIETIYSHPKALEQCKNFLKNFAGKTVSTDSTSSASKIVREKNDKKCAFIGGEYLADKDLEILAKNVANQQHNFTRFVLVGNSKSGLGACPKKLSPDFDFFPPDKEDRGLKATLIFETKHEAGALAKILTTISLLNGNLLKIESRPIPEKPHSYSFWIDIDLTGTPENLFEILAKNLHSLRVVGVYKVGKVIII
jgi:chorismate mutase/prephenate dehydratase